MEQRDKTKQLIHKDEKKYFILSFIASIIIYGLILFNIEAFIFLVFFTVILAFTNGIMMAQIRLNGVRISPQQMPGVYEEVEKLCRAMEIHKVPDVYVIESGGVLNAFATKFSGKNMIVIYSEIFDLIDTDDKEALSFVIAHELAHIKRRHVVKQMFILPAMLFPSLGKAYSRSCEYTCDRFAANYTNNIEAAVNGLTILAVGKKLFKRVNRNEYLLQRNIEKGLFVMLAEKNSTHPSLPKRIEEIQQFFSPSPASVTVRPKIAIKILAGLTTFAISLAGVGFLFGDDLMANIPYIDDIFNFSTASDEDGMDMIDAVAAGDEIMVDELLNAGTDPDIADIEGWTPLMWAAQNSDIQMIQKLLEAGADPGKLNYNEETALDFAIYQNNVEIINTLILAGADPDLADSTGWTPLMNAVSYESIEAVKALLEAGANPDLKDESQYTAYLYAVKYNYKEIADLLRK
ncbi:Zn-dependent protease with chaperone function [Mobilisporobacter senegalensis]|uniref:Zn-dependent protease with chaperone function n=1 Tax=Mobilisporobacter senegalensis TaxID=1329262 RepID=A0A3N1XUW0_9FIRM|nr:ankyrin repeat domain-containing protein [Mobilisporobacter senegalensis]ROR30400.1 Zn-dependent protease with chaperone function [Mobilisporobacter senegalensis]